MRCLYRPDMCLEQELQVGCRNYSYSCLYSAAARTAAKSVPAMRTPVCEYCQPVEVNSFYSDPKVLPRGSHSVNNFVPPRPARRLTSCLEVGRFKGSATQQASTMPARSVGAPAGIIGRSFRKHTRRKISWMSDTSAHGTFRDNTSQITIPRL